MFKMSPKQICNKEYTNRSRQSRTVASTKMNDVSSRSHAVFTLQLKQIEHDMEKDETTERVARIRFESSIRLSCVVMTKIPPSG